MKRIILTVLAVDLLCLSLAAAPEITFSNPGAGGVFTTKRTTLTSAQILALDTVPVVAMEPRHAGCAPLPWGWVAIKPAGTAYADIAADDDIVLETTSEAGYISIETTGFLDQATEQRRGGRLAAGALVDALFGLDLQFRLVGPITTGNTPLIITIVWWDGCTS